MALASGCPGARFIREARPEYVECPHCGGEVEVWSDEASGRCPRCRRPVPRERGAACIDWCAHAAECIGAAAYKRLKQ